MIIDSNKITKDTEESCDVCIVGSGAGGAPFAREMAAAGKSVIVVEEGARFQRQDFNRNTIEMSSKMYRDNAASITLGVPAILLPMGKTLGGTTTVNSGTCFKVPGYVYEDWRKNMGLKFTPENMDKYFQRVEEIIHVEDVSFDMMGSNNQLFAQGAKALGYHGAPLRRNQKGCCGVGICAFGCPEDAKQAMHVTYIPQADQLGAKFYTRFKAHKINTEAGKAVGIECVSVEDPPGMKPRTLKIRAKVVAIAASTIHTPLLLMRNRLCNSSGQLGRNLKIHPCARVLAKMDREVNCWSGCPQSYYMDEFEKEGMVFEGFWIPPAYLAITLPAYGMKLKQMMADYNKLVGFGVMVKDTSSGRVVAGPRGLNLVFYKLNKADTQTVVKGVKIAANVYFAAGAKKIYSPIHGLEEFNTREELNKLDNANVKPKDLELAAFHPMGTCRIGKDPHTSVIDENMETHDVKNLFVVDGSVFPSSLGVNPQEAIMAFSTYAAETILKNDTKYFKS